MTLTLETALSLIGTLVAIAVAAGSIVKWVIGQLRDRDLAIQAESARAKIAEDGLGIEIAEHKLYAAEHFATVGDLATALQDVKAAIERLGDRLDRALERLSQRE